MTTTIRNKIQMPSGSKLVSSHDEIAGEISVVILPPGAGSVAEVLSGAPKLSAKLTHDRGLDRPDAKGCHLAQAAIDDGGFVVLVFLRGRDAKACRQRLESSINA